MSMSRLVPKSGCLNTRSAGTNMSKTVRKKERTERAGLEFRICSRLILQKNFKNI